MLLWKEGHTSLNGHVRFYFNIFGSEIKKPWQMYVFGYNAFNISLTLTFSNFKSLAEIVKCLLAYYFSIWLGLSMSYLWLYSSEYLKSFRLILKLVVEWREKYYHALGYHSEWMTSNTTEKNYNFLFFFAKPIMYKNLHHPSCSVDGIAKTFFIKLLSDKVHVINLIWAISAKTCYERTPTLSLEL